MKILYIICMPLVYAMIALPIGDALGYHALGVLLWLILVLVHILTLSRWDRT